MMSDVKARHITRIGPTIIRGRHTPAMPNPSPLQVFPGVSKEEPMSPYQRMKEDVERLKKKWNLNF